MEKAYTPDIHDPKWQKFWQDQDLCRPEAISKYVGKPSGKTFTIVMPPPNVTGVLHQGHALMLSLEDVLTRWHRMLGDECLYLPGTDHASIAVNMQVVKHLEAKGVSIRTLGREGFLAECWKWIAEYQPRIFEQIRLTGTSCDWSRVKFTMDENLNEAVTHAFVELHKRGLIYRAERLVNWSPKGQTGLSDLEVKFEDRDSFLWHLRYPIEGLPGKFIVVATTRPETMLGDCAVAVHPEDTRYTEWIGKKVLLPLVDRSIPIIADSFVDRNFGSGAVKITPAHDHNDFEVGERHGLPRINVLQKNGSLVNNLPGEAAKWGGIDRFEARKIVVSRLEQLGLLEKTEKHKNRVGLSERWDDIVEPFLSTQWYLSMKGMGAKAEKAVKSGQVEVVPAEFHNQFLRWMEGLHDWCISRQLWWGQQIPAYHCASCAHVEVAKVAPQQCSKCKGKKLEQDPDVLDTWFSSGLWPFSVLGWPNEKSPDFLKFYPNQVLETGFDILFFWVARMLMMGLELTGKPPFSKVYLHPMVRDEHGQKMSKTKGNVKDPLDIMREHGADTLRFTFNALCVQGRDLRLSEDRIDTYRNFLNKVWNATKFCLMNLENEGPADWRKRPTPQLLHDKWILARLDAASRDVNKSWAAFRMQEAADTLYHFFWNDFCDWYLESVKVSRTQSRPVLLHTLSEALKLLHPICPHVTEDLWHQLPGVKESESLSVQVFPSGESFPDTVALAEFKFVQDFVSSLRNLRSESKMSPAKKFSIYVKPRNDLQKSMAVLQGSLDVLKTLVKLENIHFSAPAGSGPTTQAIVTAIEAGLNLEIVIPVSELVDVGEERVRLSKELETLSKIVAAQQGKLSNESFVSRAPPEVIDKERLKLAEALDKLEKTKTAQRALGEIS